MLIALYSLVVLMDFGLDPAGKQVAANDDFEPGKSFDSQIRHTPTQTGEFTIQATVLGVVPAGGMPFTLTAKQQ